MLRAFACSLALVAVCGSAGGAVASGTATRSPQLFVSPSGSDASRCTQAAPCAGFDRAYALARPGTTVLVAAGRYGDQTIAWRPGRARPKVVFRPALGARVVAGIVTVHASHLELRDFTFEEIEVPREADDVTFRNIRNRGVWMQGPSNITVVGGEVTCGVCPYHPHIDDGGPPDYRPPRNIVFDGVRFHDWQAAEADQHTECLQILAGNGITIRNSVFRNCATADNGRGATGALFVGWLGRGPKTRNILIENNFFYPSGNLYAIQTMDWPKLVLRHNSISGPIVVFGGYGDGTPVQLVGNVMRFGSCQAERTEGGPVAPLRFRHNVLDGGTCGATDLNARSGFVSPTGNLHLRRGAAAIGRADPRDFPARDIDGDRRPRGGRPDAGADEVRW